jgi:stage V sporulation protein AB
MNLLADFVLMFVGLANGIAVGSGFVAFITVLNIIPRLTQLTKTYPYIHQYEVAIVFGVVFSTWLDFGEWKWSVPVGIMIPLGLMMGIFIGMLAAALTEVTNVFPILVKRLHMQDHLLYLLMAMALGKIAGSLFQWIFFPME